LRFSLMIILFCGMPGCGKTTIAKLLAERLAGLGPVQLLSSDDLKSPVYAKIFRALAPQRRSAPFVILDATFYKREWRRQVRALAGNEDVMTVYIHCPIDVAVQRNRARQPRVAERVIHIMRRRMEPPAHPTVAIDTAATTPAEAAEKIFRLIQIAWQRPAMG
jgi:predicted kinase